MFATRRKLHGEEGQGLVEYSLIILLVAVVVVGGLTLIGGSVNRMYTTIAGLP